MKITARWPVHVLTAAWMLLSPLESDGQGAPIPSAGTRDCDSLLDRKLTDNRGNGPMEYMGLRNLRVVLKGVLYRSGANNNLNPFLSRPNNNPVSLQTLLNLWESGFDKVYYLYSDNFSSSYSSRMLEDLSDMGISYASMVPTNDSLRYILLAEIRDRIRGKAAGGMLLHCWNGWHMSGLVSALALRQFCDFSGEEAWGYWRTCTDGHWEGFAKIKARITDFVPYRELSITQDEKDRICPCRATAKDR